MHIYVEQNNFETRCHTVTEPNMARSAARFLPSIRSLLLLPLSSPNEREQARTNTQTGGNQHNRVGTNERQDERERANT
jgi:hypothetical protein